MAAQQLPKEMIDLLRGSDDKRVIALLEHVDFLQEKIDKDEEKKKNWRRHG